MQEINRQQNITVTDEGDWQGEQKLGHWVGAMLLKKKVRWEKERKGEREEKGGKGRGNGDKEH